MSEEFNLLKYFQQQRLEHTRLLRKEISRLENLENVYLAALKKVKSKFVVVLLIYYTTLANADIGNTNGTTLIFQSRIDLHQSQIR